MLLSGRPWINLHEITGWTMAAIISSHGSIVIYQYFHNLKRPLSILSLSEPSILSCCWALYSVTFIIEKQTYVGVVLLAISFPRNNGSVSLGDQTWLERRTGKVKKELGCIFRSWNYWTMFSLNAKIFSIDVFYFDTFKNICLTLNNINHKHVDKVTTGFKKKQKLMTIDTDIKKLHIQ